MDSHTDSLVVGENTIILYNTDMTVNVTPFSDDFGVMTEVPVFHGVVVYDCPIAGDTYMLIINNALYIREIEQNILPPIMMKLNSLVMDEWSKFIQHRPLVNYHSIYFPEVDTRIPLELYVTMLYIST